VKTLISRPLGYCASQVDSPNTGSREQNLLSLSYGNIVRKDIAGSDGLLPESFETYNVVEPGDTVLRLTDLQNDQRSLRVGFVQERGIITSAYVTLRPKHDVDTRFFSYVLKSMDFRKDFYALGAGVRQSLKFDELKRVQIHLPAINKQRTIADYLDRETARIDALITKKQRMIELLDERRAAFVGRAVTVGVNDAGVTATGNEFAPVVRQGWALHRLRHVVGEIVDTAHKTAPVVDGGEYLVVRTTNVKSGVLVLDGAHYTDEAAWREWTARGVPSAGDVIFTREAPAGEACLVPEGHELCIGQRTVLLRPNRSVIDGEWIVHSIYSGAAQRFIEVLAKSTTVAHINMSDIPDLPVVVPPLQEQRSVLATVRREVSRLADLKWRLGRQIELLREHRQALITSAVTGEIEVPGVAA
jgi:type I restriction enzyme S subunit